MQISKEKFCRIIGKLKEARDIQDKVDEIFSNSTINYISDFSNAASLLICHEDLVIDLLSIMFDNTEDISYFIYQYDFGESFELGDVTEKNGENIDLSTVEKLYDYLVSRNRVKRIRFSDRSHGRTEVLCPHCNIWVDLNPFCQCCGGNMKYDHMFQEDGSFQEGQGYTN